MSADPTFVPSTWNCTLAIVAPPAALALAVTVTVPFTVEPLVGAVIETVGGVVLTLFTVTFTPALVAVFPFESFATAVNVWLAFVALVVFHE
ncbi:MAG: hypothetical protein WAM08_15730 [Candidatus Acidiferrales bacterium]